MQPVGLLNMKKRIPDAYQIWIEVRKQYHLSHVQIQMARELGMNPKRFGKIANEKQEPWKAPLPAFIEHIYLKRFGRERPAEVRPIEEIWKTSEGKRQDRKRRKQLKREAEQSAPKANQDAV